MVQPGKHLSFAIDAAKLVAGTTFAQLLTIFAYPLLTRQYGPEAFGFFALFTSITGIIGVIICMRYNYAIIIPKSDGEASNVLALSLLLVAVISALTAGSLYIFGDGILSLLKAPNLAPYLVLMPPFVFVGGIFLALNSWGARKKKFGRLSIAGATSSVITTGVQLGSAFTGNATGGSLIAASLLGSLISTGALGTQIWRDDHHTFLRNISLRGMLDGLYQYKKFPIYDSGSALLNTISWQLPTFLLAVFFSPIIVGLYALGWRIVQLPMSLIGNAISQVFFQRAAELEHSGNLAPFTEGVFRSLLVIGIFPMLTLTFVGDEVFRIIFGEIWAEAGVYAQILSVWAIVWFISSPLTTIYLIKGKQEFGLIMNVTIFITRLAALMIGGFLGSPIIALVLFSASGILVYGYLCFALLKLCGVTNNWIFSTIADVTRRLIPVGLILFGLKIFVHSPLIIVASASFTGVLYYIYIINEDPLISKIVPEKLKRILLIKM